MAQSGGVELSRTRNVPSMHFSKALLASALGVCVRVCACVYCVCTVCVLCVCCVLWGEALLASTLCYMVPRLNVTKVTCYRYIICCKIYYEFKIISLND